MTVRKEIGLQQQQPFVFTASASLFRPGIGALLYHPRTLSIFSVLSVRERKWWQNNYSTLTFCSGSSITTSKCVSTPGVCKIVYDALVMYECRPWKACCWFWSQRFSMFEAGAKSETNELTYLHAQCP